MNIVRRTLYFARRSFDRADDMIFLRIEEGAAKWALRDLRREDETSENGSVLLAFIVLTSKATNEHPTHFYINSASFVLRRKRDT